MELELITELTGGVLAGLVGGTIIYHLSGYLENIYSKKHDKKMENIKPKNSEPFDYNNHNS